MTNPITKLSHWLKSVKEAIKESNRKTRVEAIRKSFYAEEKNGSLYIMHNGTAIDIFSETDGTIEDFLGNLYSYRDAAIKFEYGTE